MSRPTVSNLALVIVSIFSIALLAWALRTTFTPSSHQASELPGSKALDANRNSRAERVKNPRNQASIVPEPRQLPLPTEAPDNQMRRSTDSVQAQHFNATSDVDSDNVTSDEYALSETWEERALKVIERIESTPLRTEPYPTPGTPQHELLEEYGRFTEEVRNQAYAGKITESELNDLLEPVLAAWKSRLEAEEEGL